MRLADRGSLPSPISTRHLLLLLCPVRLPEMSRAIVPAIDHLPLTRFFINDHRHNLGTNVLSFSRANNTDSHLKSITSCIQKSDAAFAVAMTVGAPPLESSVELVSVRLHLLVSEFRSLREPIDRVVRLLHYASILPPLDESARMPVNRVTGCTTEVWLVAKMDMNGRMRFQADSDSEITKGFLSCLIWLMDGAKPEEVAVLRGEDLAEMNVGVHGRAQSRVNTWDNVLVSIKERTRALAEAQAAEAPIRAALHPLPLGGDAVVTRF